MKNHQRRFSADAIAGAASAMVGPRSWIVGFFLRPTTRQNDRFPECPLHPLQERRLQRLQERLLVPFDETRPDHQEALRALWRCAFPNVALRGLISEQWKDMGWQGSNPSTDFRGCGFISLENLLFHARTYPASFHRLLHKRDGDRSTWEYPFAIAGINISFMLIKLLDLLSDKSQSVASTNFIKFLKGGSTSNPRAIRERSICRMHSQNTRPSSLQFIVPIAFSPISFRLHILSTSFVCSTVLYTVPCQCIN
ncbi:uncharacterized protein LOC129315751 isoform X2 [Prosopis cineraria]|uniref:uncharacterized protein LOC129315751 isoform X2 n=1 Tax=Prosopis cineraria TaxID=364024 RepID=UPI00240EDE8A|nr:uncharacterized protein LOC129315751 isoform X2 [Prosopis cineraria]